MRQNGLRASSFVAVADVDPRIADQLLDLLAFAHVAAYAEPVPGHVGVYRDHHVPTRPIDRLWVDREATGPAREVLDRSLAHLHAELETAISEGVPAGGTPATDRRGQPAAHPSDGAGPDRVVAHPAGTDGSPAQESTARDTGAAPASGADVHEVAASKVTASEITASDGTEADGTEADVAAAGVTGPDVAETEVADADGAEARVPGPTTAGASTPGTPTRDGDLTADPAPSPAEPAAPGVPPIGDAAEPADGVGSPRPPVGGADLDQATVDARWRDIVAGWDGPAADGGGAVIAPPAGRRGAAPAPPPHPMGSGAAWPATAQPVPQPGDRRRTDRGPIDPARRRENRVDGQSADPPGPRDHTPDPEDEHFSPPVPTAHPPLEKTTRLGWAGLVVGLVLLVVVVAVGSELLPRWVPLLAVALLVGGFAALVSRLHRSAPDEDDHDPDDGAVV